MQLNPHWLQQRCNRRTRVFTIDMWNLRSAVVKVKVKVGPRCQQIAQFYLLFTRFCVILCSPLETRIYNDQLMRVERSFLDPEGLPPSRRHVKYNIHCNTIVLYIVYIVLSTFIVNSQPFYLHAHLYCNLFSSRRKFRPAVTLVITTRTVQDIKIRFTPYDTLVSEDSSREILRS